MVIKVNNLSFSYDNRKKIIDGLSFSLEKGQFISIIGPNGSGKSSLLKAMLQFEKPDSGETQIDGIDLSKLSVKRRAKLFSFLPQSPKIFEAISVREFVFLGRFHNKQWFREWSEKDYRMVEQAISWVGLTGKEEFSVLELSGGQRQRALLAMVLAQDTDYIFLDEPTSYLDINHQIEFIELLKHLQREMGKTVVAVLHDISLVAKYSDCVLVMKKGKIYNMGSPEKVFTPSMLDSVFSVQAKICPLANCKQVLCYDFQKIKHDSQ